MKIRKNINSKLSYAIYIVLVAVFASCRYGMKEEKEKLKTIFIEENLVIGDIYCLDITIDHNDPFKNKRILKVKLLRVKGKYVEYECEGEYKVIGSNTKKFFIDVMVNCN